MSGKSPAVSELIAREIDESGPISFARFMELALYDPGDGYYASGKVRIGKQGDFFTNVSVGAFFGRILAGQFVEVWERLGKRAISLWWSRGRMMVRWRRMFWPLLSSFFQQASVPDRRADILLAGGTGKNARPFQWQGRLGR